MPDNIKRESLTEQIQSILIERILDGTLLPGERIKELQVAHEFGTSQAPAREAIKTLTAMGYVEHRPHVGAVVKTYTEEEILGAYQIREALEGHCLLIADVDIEILAADLDVQLDNMHRAMCNKDLKAFSKADNLFHKAIVDRSGNRRMYEMWDSLKMQQQVIATHSHAMMPLDEIYALHPPIVASLKKNHRTGAARYLAKHYREIGDYWKRSL